MSTTTPAPANTQRRFQEDTVNRVLDKINAFKSTGELRLPANYSPENALRLAWLILQDTVDANKRPVLEVCTPASIANSLLEMVIKGLNPLKKQCYFIAYGNELSCDESYFGKEVTAKRVGGVKDIKGVAIYQDDIFEFEKDLLTGRNRILKHEQKFENIDHEKVKGAYAIVTYIDGTVDVEIMTMKQIRTAWNQGAARGNSPAHKNFTDEMAEKTVVSRACKGIINSTDDANLFDEQTDRPDQTTANVRQRVIEGANREEIGFPAEPAALDASIAAPAVQSEPVKVHANGQSDMGGPGF